MDTSRSHSSFCPLSCSCFLCPKLPSSVKLIDVKSLPPPQCHLLHLHNMLISHPLALNSISSFLHSNPSPTILNRLNMKNITGNSHLTNSILLYLVINKILKEVNLNWRGIHHPTHQPFSFV